MSWSRLKVPPVTNFVNLGRLYKVPHRQRPTSHQSIPQFTESLSHPEPHYGGVNLGSLYRRPCPWLNPEPRSWAYLEDGSVFIARETYNHHDLQQVLRVVDYYLRNPPDEMRAIAGSGTNNLRTRMILLEQDSSGPLLGTQYLYANGRYAHAGENISAPSTPYAALRLALDSTRTSPASITSPSGDADRKTFSFPEFLTIELSRRSTYSFRGTLIDGILQPNVVLGNGLSIYVGRERREKVMPSPTERHKEQQTFNARNYSLQEVPRQKANRTTSTRHTDTTEDDCEVKVAQLKQWERTLTQREQALHWKTKARQLEQDLSEAKSRYEKEVLQLKHKLTEARTRLQPLSIKRRQNRPGSREQLQRQEDGQGMEADQAPPTIRFTYPDDLKPTSPPPGANTDTTKATEANSVIEFLNKDETMPTNALELLRKTKPKSQTANVTVGVGRRCHRG